jgi:hypothetical protein
MDHPHTRSAQCRWPTWVLACVALLSAVPLDAALLTTVGGYDYLEASKLIRLSLAGAAQRPGSGATDALSTPALRAIRIPSLVSAGAADPTPTASPLAVLAASPSVVASTSTLAAAAAPAAAISTAPAAAMLATGSPSLTATSSATVLTGLNTLSGVIYVDVNGNGIADTADWAILGVEVQLTHNGTSDPAIVAYTKSDGYYTFSGLTAGSYSVAVLTPSPKTPWSATVGTLYDSAGNQVVSADAGEAGTAAITAISFSDGYQGIGYNFGNTAYPLAAISKRLLIGTLPPHIIPPPTPPTPPVPEPGSLALVMVAAAIGLVFARRRAVRNRS